MPVHLTVRMPASRPLPDDIVSALYRTGHLAQLIYSVQTRSGRSAASDVELSAPTLRDALGALSALALWASSYRNTTAIRPVLQLASPRLMAEFAQPVAGAQPCRTAIFDLHKGLQLLAGAGVLHVVERVLMTPSSQHRWDAIADSGSRAAYLVDVVEERVRRAQGASHLPLPRRP